MQAFPKDSANNVIGGSGPVNKNIDLNRFHGVGEDSFADFNRNAAKENGQRRQGSRDLDFGPQVRPQPDRGGSFDPSAKVDMLHGDETFGLGTSTFFEGTPAARVAIERRESDVEPVTLGRKKSLAQRIRGISNGRERRYVPGSNSHGLSPEARYERTTSPEGVQSAGGMRKLSEKNPFFQDYDQAYEKKGASIRFAEDTKKEDDIEDDTTTSGPVLKRSITEGGDFPRAMDFEPRRQQPMDSAEQNKTGGGFLSRVKSLRTAGRGKARPERQE